MPTRDRPGDRGRRAARYPGRRDWRPTPARHASRAGLSQEAIGEAMGVSHSRVGRFERGERGALTRISWVPTSRLLGMDLSLRAYPSADPLRDGASARCSSGCAARSTRRSAGGRKSPSPFRVTCGRGTRKFDRPTDPGASGSKPRCGSPTARRSSAGSRCKLRDGGEGHLLLLVADTRANRLAMPSLVVALQDAAPTRAAGGAGRAAGGPRSGWQRDRHPVDHDWSSMMLPSGSRT